VAFAQKQEIALEPTSDIATQISCHNYLVFFTKYIFVLFPLKKEYFHHG